MFKKTLMAFGTVIGLSFTASSFAYPTDTTYKDFWRDCQNAGVFQQTSNPDYDPRYYRSILDDRNYRSTTNDGGYYLRTSDGRYYPTNADGRPGTSKKCVYFDHNDGRYYQKNCQ